MRVNWSGNFITEVQMCSSGEGPKALTLHCSILQDRCKSAEGVAINLSASNCVTGIFQRRLGHQELMDVRHNAGMEDFNWSNFLVLLLAALRNERGCSCAFEHAAFGSASAVLRLCFHLQGATLSCCLQVMAQQSPPGPESLTRPYLEDLRRFFLTALEADKANFPSVESYVEDRGDIPRAAEDLHPPASHCAHAVETASLALALGTTHSTSQAHSALPATARKRPGSMLVARGVAKPKTSNPFRLGA